MRPILFRSVARSEQGALTSGTATSNGGGVGGRTGSGHDFLLQGSAPSPLALPPHESTSTWQRTGAVHTFSSPTTPLTDFSSYIISLCAGCIVTGTDLTQTSASGSFKSELDLMRAYSDWASGYTLIRKNWAGRKLRTIIGPHLGFEPLTSRIGSWCVATGPTTASSGRWLGYCSLRPFAFRHTSFADSVYFQDRIFPCIVTFYSQKAVDVLSDHSLLVVLCVSTFFMLSSQFCIQFYFYFYRFVATRVTLMSRVSRNILLQTLAISPQPSICRQYSIVKPILEFGLLQTVLFPVVS